jgi:hypothetical protein
VTDPIRPPPDVPRFLALLIAFLVCAVAFASLLWGFVSPEGGWRDEAMRLHYATIVGLSASAGTAFVIVTIFRQIEGPIKIKLAGLEISGAGGQALLWLVCFLAITFAIWLTWGLKP